MDFKNAITTEIAEREPVSSEEENADDYFNHNLNSEAFNLSGRSYASLMVGEEDVRGEQGLDREEWVNEYYDDVNAHFADLVRILRVHFPGRRIKMSNKTQLYRDFFQLAYDYSSRSR